MIAPAADAAQTGPFVVNSLLDNGDGTCDEAGVGDGCTLREAINAANFNGTGNRHDHVRGEREGHDPA